MARWECEMGDIIFEPCDAVLEEMSDGLVAVRVVQCGWLVRAFAWDIETKVILHKASMEAGHYHWLKSLGREYWDMGRFLENARKQRDKKAKPSSLKDEAFQKSYPALWEYLTEGSWGDGVARETSTLLVFVEEGQWKACLNDRDQGRTMWAAEGSWAALVALLESRLASGEDCWRQRPLNGQGKPGKGRS